jgi:glycosyltransferase involved in cell wall biosynthesis
MNRITVLVSNDLSHDQRVAKVCESLRAMGFGIRLVGRKLPESDPVERPYHCTRMRLLFRRGALFYAEFNFRLFLLLLFDRSSIILSNDLDTLLPAWIVSKIRGRKLVYDSHEYFTEAEGLLHNRWAKKVWTAVESVIFPRLESVYTVNESIASIYRNKYGVDVRVVRNMPRLSGSKPSDEPELPSELRGRIGDRKVLIIQGAFFDRDRGALAAAKAMEFLPEAVLLLIGSGLEWNEVAEQKELWPWQERIIQYPRLPYAQLRRFTALAHLGLSLDASKCLNYYYSLPNKLFDYIHAGIPVLCSDLPELRHVIQSYEVGEVVQDLSPVALAGAMRHCLEEKRLTFYRSNTLRASQELNWEKEERVLASIFSGLKQQQ